MLTQKNVVSTTDSMCAEAHDNKVEETEKEYEKLNHVTVNYEFYQSWLHQIFEIVNLDEK